MNRSIYICESLGDALHMSEITGHGWWTYGGAYYVGPSF